MTETTTTTPTITAALFKHATTIYSAMDLEAQEREGEEGETTMMVWEGHLTHLFERQGLSTPQYTHVMKCLKAMGCVEQLRRGGGSGTSAWLLRHAPSEEQYERVGTEPKRKAAITEAVKDQRFRDLVERVSSLETEVKRLKLRLGASGLEETG